VAVPLLDTGLASDLAATTDATGSFQILNVPPHTYPVLRTGATGYETLGLTDVHISGPRTMNFKLTRDWAATSGGAKVTSFSKPDYGPVCGPDLAFDASLEAGWGSDAVGSDVGSNHTGPRKVTVKLAKVVDITSFAVASGGTCGDGPRAGVKKFRIETKGKNGAWVNLGTGSVAANGAYAVFTSKIGMKNVLYVRFTMLTNHGDPLFMDVLELSVRGK
jgi:hypothetical protein